MRASQGLTLIEVLIAIVVLAVGVLAAASMQTGALSASNRARVSQELTNTARTEMERQRQFVRPGVDPAPDCLSKNTVPSGYTCTVTVAPCRVTTTTSPSLSCGTGTGTVVADQVTVSVSRPQTPAVTLRTVIARP